MKTTPLAGVLLSLAAFAPPASGQDVMAGIDAAMFPDDVRYDAAIPTPAEFLSRPLGTRPVRHHELVDYIETVAGLSERLTVEVAGFSHERRPILFVVATSPANQARIDDIRARHVALTEPAIDQPVTADMPVVTWLNYGVHGAESSGMDAALPTVYYLAAAEGDKVDRLLAGSVILVTAIFNPDGHSNRVSWLDTFGSEIVNPNPDHIEHDFDQRLARTNHYGFDLNRQWLSVTQPEPRAWMRKWHEWRPNVTVDYHEMGSEQTYYFAPGIASRTHPLIPDEGMDLVARVVRPAEAFMDRQARLYFHGDRYDHFFLGKGAGFPLVNGGVGILHEAAAARGVALDTGNGLRTYRENILKHFRTSIANAEGALAERQALLDYQRRFYDEASDRAGDHPVKAYVFAAPGDDARLYHLVDLLNFHRIRVHALGRDITEGGVTYRAGEAMIVPLAQPQHQLVRAMFETIDEFEDTTFYDVSTWTVPLAYGVSYGALSGRRLNANLLGQEVGLQMPAAPAPDVSGYGYAFAWTGYYAPRALYGLLDEGVLARVALDPLELQTTRGNVSLPRGSITVPFDRQEVSRERIHELLRTAAAEDGVSVHALTSGAGVPGSGSSDVGGQFFRAVNKPNVLLAVGRDMSWYDAGEIWHLLDVRMRMPVTLKDRDRLADVNFDRYTHIVFAGGEFEEWQPGYAARLRLWVEEGGTVIGIRQGADWLRANALDYVEPLPGQEPLAPGQAPPPSGLTESGHAAMPEPGVEPERFPYGDKERRDALDVIGGAIFAGDLDNSHPLGFGYLRRSIALHKNTTEVLTRPVNPYATVIAYATPPLMSGYASDKNLAELEGTAALIAERKGKGSVVLFADNPNFRGTWYGTNKLFLNALFFSKAFEAPPEP